MKVHLCVNFDPSTNREGPVVFLVEGDYIFISNHKHPGIVLSYEDVEAPMDLLNERAVFHCKGERVQIKFPEDYPQRSVTIVAEKQNATEHGST